MLELIFQGFMEWFYGLALECWEYFSSSLLGIMSMDYAYMKSHVPVMDSIAQMLLAAGWALLLGNLVFQALRSMASGIGFDGEDPKLLFTRTFVFSFLLLASPQICEIGLNMTAKIMELLEIPDAIDVTLVDEGMFGSLSAAWLLVIIFGIIIMFKVFRLLLEIAERYVILAVLTITAPLAFAMGGSKSTSEIFGGWCRMFGSMCTLMVTNVIFFKMLLSILSTVPTGLDIIPWIVLILTIVKVARKADAIITRIGLNPAITGDSLGRGLPGALTYAVVRTTASQITKTLGKSTGKGGRGAAPNTPTGGPRTGGPFSGQSTAGYTASYHTQRASQQQNSSQAAGQQGFVSQQNGVQQGAAQASAQEHTASAVSQSGSAIRQTSFKMAEARKSSVPHGSRRAPNYVPTVSRSAPRSVSAGNATGNTEPSTVRGPSAANTPIRTSATVQRTVSGTTASASQHDPAGKPAAPSPTRISQVNAQRIQSQVNSGAVHSAVPAEHTPPQSSNHAAVQTATQKLSPSGAGISPSPTSGGQQTPQAAAAGTRYTQRSAVQPRMTSVQSAGSAAQKTAAHTEEARSGPAGTSPGLHPTQVSADRSTRSPGERMTSSTSSAKPAAAAPRPSRNIPQPGTAPSIQTRQSSPARQELRPTEIRSTPPSKGAMPVRHPGPAGNQVSCPESAATRPVAGSSVAEPKNASVLAKPPSSAVIKGSVKKNENGAASRKQRGKKHE